CSHAGLDELMDEMSVLAKISKSESDIGAFTFPPCGLGMWVETVTIFPKAWMAETLLEVMEAASVPPWFQFSRS
ncbi:hypothetical protein H6F38_36080, partial [Paenibacillus sp. EKM208P]